MSKQATAEISCDKCGHDFEIEVYVSVNSKHNPELKKQIFNHSFFKHACKSCGNIIDSYYEVLYHDMERNFMVWLVKPDTDNILFMQHGSLKIATVMQDYRFHIARFPFQWTERIKTLENGMDPRIIELYKFGVKIERGLSLTTTNDMLFFCKFTRNILSIGRTIFHWDLVYDDGGIEQFGKAIDAKKYKAYEDLVKSVQPVLSSTSWYLVDWQFPFGIEIEDGELIQLPETSEFVEIGESKTKLPSQFLDVVRKSGKGKSL